MKNTSLIKKYFNNNSLSWHFIWIFLGKGIYAATQWGILIVLVKLGNPQVVGQYGYALAITAPAVALLNMDLRSLLASDIKDNFSFQEYLSTRMVTICFFLIVTLIIIIVSSFSTKLSLVILCVAMAKAIENISDLLFGFFQKNEKMRIIATSEILKGIFSLIGVTIVYSLTKSLIISLCCVVVSRSVVLYFYDRKQVTAMLCDKKIFFSFDTIVIKRIIVMALPVGVSSLIISFGTNFPRYLIEHYYSEEILGYFVALFYFIAAGDVLFLALRQSTIHRLADYYRINTRKFLLLLIQTILIALTIGAIVIIFLFFFSEKLITIIYDENYVKYSDVLIWLMLAGTARYIFGFIFSALIVMRSIRMQMVIICVSTVLGITAAWFFIPNFGLVGAAWSFLITACANIFFGSIVIMHTIRSLRV